MMIAKNNEEERSKLWNIVMSASTIVIILIVIFFCVKIFTSNPLEGAWMNDDESITLDIKAKEEAVLQWPEKLADQNIGITMSCTVNKKLKTVQLQMTSEGIKAAAEASDGKLTEAEIEAALQTMESTFDYSVDGNELTLTDREYGDQMFFERKN